MRQGRQLFPVAFSSDDPNAFLLYNPKSISYPSLFLSLDIAYTPLQDKAFGKRLFGFLPYLLHLLSDVRPIPLSSHVLANHSKFFKRMNIIVERIPLKKNFAAWVIKEVTKTKRRKLSVGYQ